MNQELKDLLWKTAGKDVSRLRMEIAGFRNEMIMRSNNASLKGINDPKIAELRKEINDLENVIINHR